MILDLGQSCMLAGLTPGRYLYEHSIAYQFGKQVDSSALICIIARKGGISVRSRTLAPRAGRKRIFGPCDFGRAVIRWPPYEPPNTITTVPGLDTA